MTRSLALAAAAAMLALPAGADQLARSLGVPPGVYTTAELILMRQARQDHDPQRRDWVVDRAVGSTPRLFLRDWTPGAEPDAPSATPSNAARLATEMGLDRDSS